MKKIYLGLLAVLCFSMAIWAYAGDYSLDAINASPTQIKFDKTEIDLGKLKYAKSKTLSFNCENIGEYPLLIRHIETACGCTQAQWPKHPIKPNESAEIKISYDAKHPGRFLKTISVFCNTEKGMVKLKIKGEVKLSKKDKIKWEKEQKLVTS
jgi:hypothetical protein